MNFYTVRPITVWPQPETRSRKVSQFRALWSETLDLLARELRMLNARNVVLQAFASERDIRIDGQLRSDGRPFKPGVILSFETKDGPISMPCDTYTHWQDNVRAIALSLEALRAVNRYGVAKVGEQYRGWKALPPAPANSDFSSIDDAVAWLSECDGGNRFFVSEEQLRFVFRRLSARFHPDRGGNPANWLKLQSAAALFKSVNGWVLT